MAFTRPWWRKVGRAVWRVLKGTLLAVLLVVAVSGFPAFFGRRPRPGPPRPQGAVTREMKRKS